MKIFYAIILFALVASTTNAQCAWIQKTDFTGVARVGAVGFSIGTKGYIGTGGSYSGSVYYKDFWEWDQATNVWTQKADFGGLARREAVGFSIGTKGYIGTGINNSSAVTKDFWEWDQLSNTWIQKADFAGATRSSSVGFSIGTKGYIGTGTGNLSANYKDFWEWDQTTNVWTQKANFGGVARRYAIGFSIGTKGYIGIGDTAYSSNSCRRDFWEWDQTTNIWIQKANFVGKSRDWAVGFSIGTKGYVGTGRDSLSSFKQDFWEWDQSSDSWTQKTNFGGIARTWAVGFSIGSKGYIGTGASCLSNSCLTKDFWEYNPLLDFTITISKTNLTCNNSGNGTATIMVSGSTPPYTYKWNNGQTSATTTGLTAGVYTVTTTAANGCTSLNTVTVAQPAVLSTSISVTNPNSCTANNGTATANVSGGTAPYSFLWNPSGQTSQTATGLMAGTYTVTITDANNCTSTKTASVIQSAILSVSVNAINPSSCNSSDGSLTANVSGGTPPYTYSWNPSGQNTKTATGLSVGTYTVVTTDVNSCNTSAIQTITVIDWIQKVDFGGTGRTSAVGFSIGSKGYIGTGNNGGAFGTNYTDFWEWNQATNVWTQKASLGGVARRGAVGFSIGTKGYIGTGSDGNSVTYGDFWEWNQATNVWIQKASIGGLPRYNAVGFSIGTKGYIGTGIDASSTETKDFWEWDQVANVWTQKASLPGSVRYGAIGFSIGTKGYIGTGRSAVFGSNYRDFWEWNQASNVWIQKGDFGGIARSHAVGFSIGNKGYIGTGYASTYLNDFWEWDQATDIWSQKTNASGVGRDAAVGFSIGTKGYIGAGYDNGASDRKDFWEYTPCLTTSTTVDEVAIENPFYIYPNPSLGIFVLYSEISKGEITIYNFSGQKILSQKIKSEKTEIDLSIQPKGVYFIEVLTQGKKYNKKLIIQ